MKWIGNGKLSASIELVSSSARVTSVKSQQAVSVSYLERPGHIDRTPGIPGFDNQIWHLISNLEGKLSKRNCVWDRFSKEHFSNKLDKIISRGCWKQFKPNLVFSSWSAGLQEQKARRRTIRRFFIPLLMPEIQATISIEADADKNIF